MTIGAVNGIKIRVHSLMVLALTIHPSMSRQYWNSVGERLRLRQKITVAMQQLNQSSDWEDEMLEDLSLGNSVDSSDASDVSDASDISDVAPMDISGANTTFESVDTVDLLIEDVAVEAREIFGAIEDETIDFNAPMLRIADLNKSSNILQFRFCKTDLQLIADLLWPRMSIFIEGDKDKIKCTNRYSCPYETGVLLCLFRLSRPRRLRPDMESFFHMRKSHISACLQTFMEAFYKVSMPYFNSAARWKPRFELYAHLIRRKSRCTGINIWGFINGTVRKTCRPSRFQRLLYSGHKRVHGIKFQSVVTPDGFIALLFGPIPGNRHDSYMLRESGLLDELEALMPDPEDFYSLFGDPAYPQSRLLFGGFRHPAEGSVEAQWNKQMSSVRESVEWLFGGVIKYWSFLDFRPSMKIFNFPVAQYFQLGAFLTNIHNAIYSGQTGKYFKCTTTAQGALNLEQYLNLVPIDEYNAEQDNDL